MIVAVLEEGEFAANFAEALPALVAIGNFVKVVDVLGHFGEDDAGEVFKEVAGAFVIFEFRALLGQVTKTFLAVLMAEPILIAAMAPFGEVLLADRFAGEDRVEEVFGCRQFVEPIQHG